MKLCSTRSVDEDEVDADEKMRKPTCVHLRAVCVVYFVIRVEQSHVSLNAQRKREIQLQHISHRNESKSCGVRCV